MEGCCLDPVLVGVAEKWVAKVLWRVFGEGEFGKLWGVTDIKTGGTLFYPVFSAEPPVTTALIGRVGEENTSVH